MKIGEFSNKYHLSYDTIRYYMKLNLIIPEKRGGYYYFDERCQREVNELIKLKGMAFSLLEIKEILTFKRIGRLTAYQQNHYYQSLYKDKIKQINYKMDMLTKAKGELNQEIVALQEKNTPTAVKIGIDLTAIEIFSCPRCKRDLFLTADKVEMNQIIEGALTCTCGEMFPIQEGILYINQLSQNGGEIEENHIENYIKSTNPLFLDKSYHSLEWLQRQLATETLAGKVILEPGSGYGHFLRQIYDKLPDNTLYVCVDHNPAMHQFLKSLLEMTGKNAKIIFIVADLSEQLPLKEGVIDMCIDYTGTSCYSFEQKDFLPALLDQYLKRSAMLLATFIIYKQFGPNNIVPKEFRKNFKYDYIKQRLVELNFNLKEAYESETQIIENSMGKYEEFAQLGDHIYSYQIKAGRWS